MRISGNLNGGFGTIYVGFANVASATATTASMASFSTGPSVGSGFVQSHPHQHVEFVLGSPASASSIRLAEVPDAKFTPLDGR